MTEAIQQEVRDVFDPKNDSSLHWHLVFLNKRKDPKSGKVTEHNLGVKLYPKVVEMLDSESVPCFVVEEVGKEQGLHHHMVALTNWSRQEFGRKVDKLRDGKNYEVSYRQFRRLGYYTKGASPVEMPKVIHNTVPNFSNDVIKELHDKWWQNSWQTIDDPDFKEMKPFHELVEWVKEKTERKVSTTPRECMEHLIDIYVRRGGAIAFSNRNLMQNYVRTAMMFSKDAKKYRNNISVYLMDGL